MIFERVSVGDDWSAEIPYKITILEEDYTLEKFLKAWLEHIKKQGEFGCLYVLANNIGRLATIYYCGSYAKIPDSIRSLLNKKVWFAISTAFAECTGDKGRIDYRVILEG